MAGAPTGESFQSLGIPRKDLPVSNSAYRIYKDAKEFVVVQAPTALAAFEASGLKEAYRIERESLGAQPVVGISAWPKDAAKADGTKAEEGKSEEPKADAPAAEDKPAAEEKPA